ncbi:acyltransferase family protein [Streptomyces sp. NPDC002537]
MRALAVTAVVIYHANPGWLPGGFLGVDVFFVLSGYLITHLILTERAQADRIDLRSFWLRRARRLLPALATMLVATTAAATLAHPQRLATAVGDLLSAATFTNNWWQIATDASYFANFGPPPLFQHLWTLSLEEQFYLLWPLILACLLRFVTRNGARSALALAAAVSSAVAMALEYVPGEDPSRVYFGTDTHAFPMLAGAALALLGPSSKSLTGQSRLRARIPDLAGGAALVVLVLLTGAVSQDAAVLYPLGFAAAGIAACIMVYAAVQPSGLLVRCLSAAPLRWLGTRSYGIYLWHFPAISLVTPDGKTPADVPLQAIAAIAAAAGLAELSYRFVEQPIRRHGFRAVGRRLGRAFAVAAAPTAATVCAVAVILVAGYGVITAPSDDGSAAAQIRAGQRALESKPPAPAPARRLPTPVSVGQIVAIGDSVMLAATPALQAKFPGIEIDARESRQLSSAPHKINSLKQEGRLGDTVIIGLGTNGVGDSADLQAAIDAIGPGKHIVLVTVHAQRDWRDAVNRDIRTAADHSPNVLLADWDKAITGHDDLLYDGIHPKPAGGKIYANTIAAVLGSMKQ